MVPAEMSKRTHFWLRVAALAVIAAAAAIPRSGSSAREARAGGFAADGRSIHADVLGR